MTRLCELYPPDLRNALAQVASRPHAQRLERIDALTDEAARRGLARPRTSDAIARSAQAWARGQG